MVIVQNHEQHNVSCCAFHEVNQQNLDLVGSVGLQLLLNGRYSTKPLILSGEAAGGLVTNGSLANLSEQSMMVHDNSDLSTPVATDMTFPLGSLTAM